MVMVYIADTAMYMYNEIKGRIVIERNVWSALSAPEVLSQVLDSWSQLDLPLLLGDVNLQRRRAAIR